MINNPVIEAEDEVDSNGKAKLEAALQDLQTQVTGTGSVGVVHTATATAVTSSCLDLTINGVTYHVGLVTLS